MKLFLAKLPYMRKGLSNCFKTRQGYRCSHQMLSNGVKECDK